MREKGRQAIIQPCFIAFGMGILFVKTLILLILNLAEKWCHCTGFARSWIAWNLYWNHKTCQRHSISSMQSSSSFLQWMKETRALHTTCSVLSHFSSVWLFATPGTLAHQAPLFMGSLGKNTGVGCHALLQGIFLTRDWTCVSYLKHSGGFFTTSATWKAQ